MIKPMNKNIYSIEIKTSMNKQRSFSEIMTANQLRIRLNKEFYDKGLDAQALEVKYLVMSNSESIRKFQESMRSGMAPQTIPNCNQIRGCPFLESVFDKSVCVPIEKIDNFEFDYDQLGELQRKEEEAIISSINESLTVFMKVLNSNNCTIVPRCNERLLAEVDKAPPKVKIFASFYTHQQTIQKLVNYPIILESNVRIHLHPRGQHTAEDVQKLREHSTVSNWSIGAADEQSLINMLDMRALETKVKRENSSVNFKLQLLREETDQKNPQRIRKLELFSDLFEKLALKAEVYFTQITHVWQTQNPEEPEAVDFWLKLDYPPSYYATIYSANQSQDIAYCSQWKRIENFLLLRNDNIIKDKLLRLHLYKNTVVKITAHKTIHSKSYNFLNNLFKQHMFKAGTPFVRALPLQKMYVKFRQEQFQDKLAISDLPDAVVWGLKFKILSLIGSGQLYAGHALQLLDKVEAGNIYAYDYVLRKMCDSQTGSGMEYIDQKYREIQNWSQKLLNPIKAGSMVALVFRVNITPSGYIFNGQSPQMLNRMLRQYNDYTDHFLRAAVLDDDASEIKNSLYVTKYVFRNMFNYVNIINRKYIPLGWSPSQLRRFCLWMVYENKEIRRTQILNFLGDFRDITPPAKMAARIGQAFSSSWSFEIKDPTIIVISDIKNQKGLLFTDGIGKMSKNIANLIALKLKISQLGAIQIRYLGAKGVLAVDESLKDNTICLRPSMIKYKNEHPHAKKYLDVLNWNKYKGGYLNRQIIILLRTAQVPDEIFLDYQERYINKIQEMSFRECTIYQELESGSTEELLGGVEPANMTIRNLTKSGFELDSEPFFKGILKVLKKNGYQKLKDKSNISVPKSARLIGIVDQYQVLQEGQLYCRIHDSLGEQPAQTIVGAVILVRNPCLHPGDIRKLTCVSEQEITRRFNDIQRVNKNGRHPFNLLPNCVIMTQKGSTPITCEISGSDLDGDHFFISWDENLVSLRPHEAYIIPPSNHFKIKRAPGSINEKDYEEMLNFFSDYMNYEKLGKIANSHLIKSDKDLVNYSRNPEAIELAKAHGSAVDFPKSGYSPEVNQRLFETVYPDFMEKPPSYASQSVLGKLYRSIKDRIENLLQGQKEKEEPIFLDADLLFSVEPELKFTDEEISEALKVLRRFEHDLDRIKDLAGLSNEFEIYTGNTNSPANQKKTFKTGRLVELIINLKRTYCNIFFEDKEKDIDRYGETTLFDQTRILEPKFSKLQKRKAVLWYCVSYCSFFENIRYHNEDALALFSYRLKEQTRKLEMDKKKAEFFGMVWFVIPKVLMEVKMENKGKFKRQMVQAQMQENSNISTNISESNIVVELPRPQENEPDEEEEEEPSFNRNQQQQNRPEWEDNQLD